MPLALNVIRKKILCSAEKSFVIWAEPHSRSSAEQFSWTKRSVITTWRACIWSNSKVILWIFVHKISGLCCIFPVFLYILSWNDSINGCKNYCSGDSCNNFYRSSSSNYSACNPWPWWWNRYVQPLNITFENVILPQKIMKIWLVTWDFCITCDFQNPILTFPHSQYLHCWEIQTSDKKIQMKGDVLLVVQFSHMWQ